MVYIKHPKHIQFEYNKITSYIYIGTNQCCISDNFAKKLIKKGIEADISLEYERIDSPFGAKYFMWLPVKDHTSPSQSQLLIGAKTIKNFVDAEIKVYVHCKRAHGRSPTLVAAYFILKGMTTKDAIKTIKQKRAIHLRDSQIKTLEKFEKTLRKRAKTIEEQNKKFFNAKYVNLNILRRSMRKNARHGVKKINPATLT